MSEQQPLPPPGWYPEAVPGQYRFWNGAEWTDQIKATPLAPPSATGLPAVHSPNAATATPQEPERFRLLFRRPVRNDWAFIVWAIMFALTTVGYFLPAIKQAGNTGLPTTFAGIFSGTIDAIFGILINAIMCWIYSLFWLIPRRVIASRRAKRLSMGR